jgi:hypothetical protein
MVMEIVNGIFWWFVLRVFYETFGSCIGVGHVAVGRRFPRESRADEAKDAQASDYRNRAPEGTYCY